MDKKIVSLNVADTYHEDIGLNIVRLDSNSLNKLNMSEGEYILINEKCLARVLKCYVEDEGLDLVRMDSSLRSNSSVQLGDVAKCVVVDVLPAKSIEISPTEQVNFQGDPTALFLKNMIGKAYTKGNVVTFNLMGTTLHYLVSKCNPKGFVRIDASTKVNVSSKITSAKDLKIPTLTYDDIGGLKEEITAIREMVEIPMKHPEVFEKLGIKPPRGVLLYGPPGTGKTLLARALANELDANFMEFKTSDIISAQPGQTEKNMEEFFKKANDESPTIVFIDEIDSFAFKRENRGSNEFLNTPVTELLKNMDGLVSRGDVLVIAATNRPDVLDDALRRPGRFDREIPINPPSRDGRLEILDVHTRGIPMDDDVDLSRLADLTHGFTGADLEVLTKEAAMKSLKNWIPDLIKTDSKIPTVVLEKLLVNMAHFREALNKIEPSAMREVLIQKPNVRWDDIGGLEEVKEQLREMVELPLKEPELFIEVGIKAPKGVLLTGPPGTGKTMLAKAIATESEANFISIKGPELINSLMGSSEKAIREIFKKAKQVSPTIIFFDEFDSIAGVRGQSNNNFMDKIVNQLLTEMDGVEELSGVSIVAATNRADMIDPALKRPGRLDSIVEVSLPDEKTREKIFSIYCKKMPIEKNVNFAKLAKLSYDFSGAMIEGVCQKAGLRAIRTRTIDKSISVGFSFFEEEIKRMR
ncbi:MAG: CDC48 family AAA ATPase [Nanoarchaeales archaeon]|nr:CDC48 family AAA ATPase [Nanoarchaeales archaeon]